MKTTKLYSYLILLLLVCPLGFISCGEDDDEILPPNEENENGSGNNSGSGTESSKLNPSTLLYTWYDITQYAESLFYESEGNPTGAKNAIKNGYTFTSSSKGYQWEIDKWGTTKKYDFTWYPLSGDQIYIDHPEYGECIGIVHMDGTKRTKIYGDTYGYWLQISFVDKKDNTLETFNGVRPCY